MSCPFLKRYYVGENRDIVMRYSCRMGKALVDLPTYCATCSLNPEGGMKDAKSD